MGSNDMPELGSKISLISKADIRYEGKLFTVDPQDCTIALANVRSFGTEDRVTDHPVPAQAQVYDYILFRATDIKDISVIPSPPVLFDPAIVQLSVPPSITSAGGSRFQGGFQHPIVGAFGSGAADAASRTVGSGTQPSYNPMQASSLLNPLQQRSRQTRSVAELLGSTAAGGGGGAVGTVTTGSRSSTPGLGRRISEQGTQSGGNQRQSPPRYGGPDQGNQRNRNNSQSNSSNHEDRSYNSRQYSQTKTREQQQQPQQQQQQQQQRFGNRNMDNGFNRNDGGYNNRDNRNDGGYNRDNRNDGGFNRDNRNNDGGFNRDNRNDNGFNRNDGFMRNNDNYGNRNNQQQNMQQRRYQQQQPGGQQNQRIMHPRGGSGDRLQDQQQRGGLGGQRRNQGWTNNNQRQGGGQRQGQRQNNQRRQFAFNGQPKQQQAKQPLKFDSDYDFDKANTEFEELRLSLAQVKIAEGNNAAPAVVNPPPANPADDKKDDSGNETAVGECDQEDEGVQQVSSAYDKTKSFFDNISCEAIERSKGRSQRTDWRKELKLNSETFGVTMSRRFYIPRGRGYYNRGSSWNYKPRQQQNNMITAKV